MMGQQDAVWKQSENGSLACSLVMIAKNEKRKWQLSGLWGPLLLLKTGNLIRFEGDHNFEQFIPVLRNRSWSVLKFEADI